MFSITFRGVEELLQAQQRAAQLLDANIKVAVTRTVLWGAAKMAEDCPVDTGRLRSSILGYLAEQYGVNVDMPGDPQVIEEGKRESVTGVNGYAGLIGTNVKYAAAVDLGLDVSRTRAPLTPKQLRYLFAVGILESGPNGSVIYNYRPRARRGRGFFRNNIPLIDNYFQRQMREAIAYSERGELMPVTF